MSLSAVLGWSYFAAWSVSFYPQVFLNAGRRSTHGLSQDFCALNFGGFLCYSVYTAGMRFSSQISDEYERRWGSKPAVPLQDVIFALHALVLSGILLLQTVLYNTPRSSPSTWVWKSLILALLGASFFLFQALFGHLPFLDALYYLSGLKISVTLVKYIPQALLNYKNNSTIGWSIGNIMLDFTGGILSIAQQIWDAHLAQDPTILLGNPVKTGLGLFSILFDLVFMIQHWVLFGKSNDSLAYEREEDASDLPSTEHDSLLTSAPTD